MRIKMYWRKIIGTAIASLALCPPSWGTALASVGGEVITDVDVTLALGYFPEGGALREAVTALVERKIILTLAKNKALAASAEEVSRAATLAAKAHRPPPEIDRDLSRRYLEEEVVIKKFIDLYVYPRIRVEEGALRAYFAARPSAFMKRPPRDRAALERLYPQYRNEVLYRYVKKEIRRLLVEAGNKARADLAVAVYI
ncbi:MAG: hypothetical protein GTN49_08540 [candidate division Zixibacteria bacterium]|nr:hypothetical protein [candidate division Zixibacteria bacterium]